MKLITARSPGQEAYIESLKKNIVTVCLGNAGTGKSFLALYTFINMMKEQKSKINKIIYFRPSMPDRIEDNIGFLPGTADEKVRGLCGGLFHNLEAILGTVEAKSMIDKGFISTELLSYIRGSSYNNCCLILDEASLLKVGGGAMKLFLSRIGKNCHVAVLGDKKTKPIK